MIFPGSNNNINKSLQNSDQDYWYLSIHEHFPVTVIGNKEEITLHLLGEVGGENLIKNLMMNSVADQDVTLYAAYVWVQDAEIGEPWSKQVVI